MVKMMPQEIAVWYLLPSLRKEISKELLKHEGVNQKKVANLLGITEAAISQYLKKKRANEIIFGPQDKKKIAETAKKMLKNQSNAETQLYKLSKELMGSKDLCRIHKKLDLGVPKKCTLCGK